MKTEDVKALGEAIAQNSTLLVALDDTDLQGVEYTSTTRSIGLLKNARIIEESDEEGIFFPGDNFELLSKAINAHRHIAETPLDIVQWFDSFKMAIADFYDALEGNDNDESQYRRQVFRHVRQIASKLNDAIRKADYEISTEFGSAKTNEAKLRRTQYYLNATKYILERLGRLNYSSLKAVLPYPHTDMDIALLELDSKLNKLRSSLRSVVTKIQKHNIQFKKIEGRTRRIEMMLAVIANNQVSLDINDIDVDHLLAKHGKLSNGDIVPKAQFNVFSSFTSQEIIFNDIANKLKLDRTDSTKVTQNDEPIKLERHDDGTPAETESVDHMLAEQKRKYCEYLKTHLGQSVSLSAYWRDTPSLFGIIDVRAWLYEMVHWLGEIDNSHNAFAFSMNVIQTPACKRSETYVVSDIETTLESK